MSATLFFWQVITALNNLEHVLQYLVLVPTELNFEEDTRGSVSSGSNYALNEQVAVNGLSPGNLPLPGRRPSFAVSTGENEAFLADLVASACDYMDIVIYTVLETLQGKVCSKLCRGN